MGPGTRRAWTGVKFVCCCSEKSPFAWLLSSSPSIGRNSTTAFPRARRFWNLFWNCFRYISGFGPDRMPGLRDLRVEGSVRVVGGDDRAHDGGRSGAAELVAAVAAGDRQVSQLVGGREVQRDAKLRVRGGVHAGAHRGAPIVGPYHHALLVEQAAREVAGDVLRTAAHARVEGVRRRAPGDQVEPVRRLVGVLRRVAVLDRDVVDRRLAPQAVADRVLVELLHELRELDSVHHVGQVPLAAPSAMPTA